MRIAFAGKGGSGKSTLSASFASYLSKHTSKPVAVFDADLNMHIPELLGLGPFPFEKHLSHPTVSRIIKTWLIGKNDISELGAFRKSTPPARKSNILRIEELDASLISRFSLSRNNLFVFAVGTYQEEDIGASCYHNNLAIFENILSHTDDKNGYVIADMVAGVDSFAGTLHAQFDLTCLIIEPTKRSVEVYERYAELAEEAGVSPSIMVIGNKVRNGQDIDFISGHIPNEKILGYFYEDEHVRRIDQDGGHVDVDFLNHHNAQLMKALLEKLDSLPDGRQKRLENLWLLHKKYVLQPFIIERFGNLIGQIDTAFNFDGAFDVTHDAAHDEALIKNISKAKHE
jgi:CO dehydrogenase maturation factor